MNNINRTSSASNTSSPDYPSLKSEEANTATKIPASSAALKPQSKGIVSGFLAMLGFSKVEKGDTAPRKDLAHQVEERATQYGWKAFPFFLKSDSHRQNLSSSLTSTVRSSSVSRSTESVKNANSPEVNTLVDKLIADRENYQGMLASYQDIPEAKQAYTQALAILDNATGDVASLTAARHAAATVIAAAKVQILAEKIIQRQGKDSVEVENIQLQAREAHNASKSVQKALKEEPLNVEAINQDAQQTGKILSQLTETYSILKNTPAEESSHQEELLQTDIENRASKTEEAANIPLPEEKVGEFSNLERKVDQFITDTEQDMATKAEADQVKHAAVLKKFNDLNARAEFLRAKAQRAKPMDTMEPTLRRAAQATYAQLKEQFATAYDDAKTALNELNQLTTSPSISTVKQSAALPRVTTDVIDPLSLPSLVVEE